MKYMVTILLLTLVQLQRTLTADVYEKSDNLCTTRCNCESSDGNQTLTINCSEKQMTNVIANWPPHKEILIAIFSRNHIQTLETMPASNATTIKLIFSQCGIIYLESGLFEATINVKFVDLSHNLITSDQLSSNVFKGPYNNTMYEPIALEYLDLSYNKIHSLQKDIFEHTPFLKSLNLEGNAMRIIDHVTRLAFASIPNTIRLNLAENRLTELPPDAIKHFPNLTELNLSHNEFDFVPQSLGYVASSLQILNIDGNPIIELAQESFEGMHNLLHLSANNLTELTWVRPRTFSELKKLQTLALMHNEKLTEIDNEAFADADTLEALYLNDNSLSTLPNNLSFWWHVKILDIRGNPLVCNCDLFNISSVMSKEVKRDKNGPYCLNPRTLLNMDVYYLTRDICLVKPFEGGRYETDIYGNFKTMRATLIMLVIILIVSSAVALWLACTKWKSYKRSLSYPFPNQIVYNPVSTRDTRY